MAATLTGMSSLEYADTETSTKIDVESDYHLKYDTGELSTVGISELPPPFHSVSSRTSHDHAVSTTENHIECPENGCTKSLTEDPGESANYSRSESPPRCHMEYWTPENGDGDSVTSGAIELQAESPHDIAIDIVNSKQDVDTTNAESEYNTRYLYKYAAVYPHSSLAEDLHRNSDAYFPESAGHLNNDYSASVGDVNDHGEHVLRIAYDDDDRISMSSWPDEGATAATNSHPYPDSDLESLREILAALGDVDTSDPVAFIEAQMQLYEQVVRPNDDLDADELALFRFLRRISMRRSSRHLPPPPPPEECQVCLAMVRLTRRSCCNLPVCNECLETYVETQLLDLGNVRIGCPNADCKSAIFQEEIRRLLQSKPDLRDRFDRWLVDMNGDPCRKTCPRCCAVTEVDPAQLKDRRVARHGLRVQCSACQLEWCFPCQAPWHEGIKCKQYRAGDVLLKNWTVQFQNGQRNAQRCPKCKVYVQRNEGCDHMTCRCGMEFCYRCGGRRLPSFKLFGVLLEDHDLRHSIIGCNSTFCKGKPVQRVLARGAIFSAKVLAGIITLPLLLGIGGAVVAVAAAVAAVAAPAYGTYKLAQHIRKTMNPEKYN